ncbi:alpha/beta hydrolase [Rossellomorea sp. LjRoot5]|uniref:alpha/beta hydrolase n=1 Tax=Rossellomorea sp. LjRoot5 TaxID=3342331 RepID=UPI003ECC5E85
MNASLKECVITSQHLRRDQLYYTCEYKRGQGDVADLLFVQDGLDYVEIGHIQQTIQTVLKNSGHIHLMLVLVPPLNSMDRYHLYHPDGELHESYVHFFTEELLPNLQAKLGREGQEIRKVGLLGDSLGAAISMSIACASPESWSHLLLQSGAFTVSHVNKIQNIRNSLWKVYQVVGLQEEAVTYPLTGEILPILSINRILHNQLLSITDTITYYEEDEQHLWDFWRRDLPRALNYFVHTITKGERDEQNV